MQKIVRLLLSAMLSLVLVACGGKGDSAPPPRDFAVIPGDGQVTLTWTPTSGVDYWIFWAPGTLTNGQDFTQVGGHRSLSQVSQPSILPFVNANATYTYSVDGRIGNAPGGPKATYKYALARPAGNTWSAATKSPNLELKAVTFGIDSGGSYQFLAVGSGGGVFSKNSFDTDDTYSNTDGVTTTGNWTWNAVNSANIGSANLTATTYIANQFLVADDSGKIYSSSDLSSWSTPISLPSAARVNAMASNVSFSSTGASGTAVVAVGNGGAIWYAPNGTDWASPTYVSTGKNLLGVTYANGYWIAVGEDLNIWYSQDATNWSQAGGFTNTHETLYGVAYRPALSVNPINGSSVSYPAQYVFVGAGGRYLSALDVTSSVTSNWTSGTVNTAATFTAVTATSSQFLAVDNAGNSFTLVDGLSWGSPVASSTAGLNSVINTMGLAATNSRYITARYVSVGTNGKIVYSR